MKNVESVYPATAVQQGMLFESLYTEGRGVYVNQLAIELSGDAATPLDLAAWRRSWEAVVARHPVLRTAFLWEGLDDVLQVVRREVEVPWREVDASDWDDARAERHWRRLLRDDRRRGFDPRRAPLSRFTVLRHGDGRAAFLWTHHHLLLDGWSLDLVVDEALSRYRAEVSGAAPPPPAPPPFEDYVAWLQGRDAEADRDFWRRRLAGVTAPTPLGVDRLPGAPAVEAAESGDDPADPRDPFGDHLLWLDAETSDGLRRLASRFGVTAATLAHGLWALLLARYSGESGVLVGSVTSGRPTDLPGVEAMVGMFINTLPLRLEVPPKGHLGPWLEAVQGELLALRDHEHSAPADVQRWSDVPTGTPLYESIVVVQNQAAEPVAGGGGDNDGLTTRLLVARERNGYPLTVHFAPGEKLGIQVINERARLDDGTARRLLSHLSALAGELAARAAGDGPGPRLGDLQVLPEEERSRVLVEWNDTGHDWPRQSTGGDDPLEWSLDAHVAAQARRTPEAEAVRAGGEAWSYRELQQRVDHLARHLADVGVGPGDVVGVELERSRDLLAALLAPMRLGAAYLPLDPDHPPRRRAELLADAGAEALLTHGSRARPTPRGDLPTLAVDELWRDLEDAPEGGAGISTGGAAAPLDVAYVIYTSGSTGAPKGVMVPHRAIVNRLLWMQSAYPLATGDRVLQKTPVGFDVSVWELFWPLMVGATVVMARPGGHKDPAYLVDVLEREAISTLHFVPSMLQLFLQAPDLHRVAAVRQVVASGEALPADLVERFHERMDATLDNLYGPTEAAVDVTAWTCRRDDDRAVVPIGRPIANLRTVVLDPVTGAASGVGVPGELHLGGVGLARGYLGRPRRTALAFVPDPHAGRLPGVGAGSRLYRTGDRVRWLADGSLEFLGRLDHQVKVRGFRVELGEVEAALAAHPAIREAVAAVHGAGADARLAAYLVPEGDPPPTVEALREHLGERLPEAMVPTHFIVLDRLPLNANGKVDRGALPEPSAARPDLETPYSPPRTPTEEVLAAAFASVLGLDRVGRDDTFFALGGDSLTSLRVVAKAAERGVEIRLPDLFRRQTIAELAARLDAPEADGDAVPEAAVVPAPPFHGVPDEARAALPDDVGDAYPLSRLQEGMLFESQWSAGRSTDGARAAGALYHDHLALHLVGPFDAGRLRRRLAGLAARHPVLRTSFDLSSDPPLQRVHHHVTIPLHQVDRRGAAEGSRRPEPREVMADLRRQDRARRFDPARPPLLRATVHLLDDESWVLGLGFHHAILDGLSFAELTFELLAGYARDETAAAPPPPAFRWFVAAEREALAGGDALAGWRRYLADVPKTWLPPHPGAELGEEPSWSGRMRTLELRLPEEVSAGLLRLARREALPVKSVLLAVHLRVLAHLTGRRRPATGVIVHNRPEAAGADRALGLFLNTLPLAVEVGGTWAELAAAAFDSERVTLPWRLVPWPEIRHGAARGERLFDSVFNFAHFDAYARLTELPGLKVAGRDFYEEAELALAAIFSLGPANGGVSLTLEHRTDRLTDDQAAAIGEAYRRALAAAAADPDAPVHATSLLATAEDQRLLVSWGHGGPLPDAAGLPLHHAVAEAAEAHPDAVAVVDVDGRATTYRALWRKAETIARAAAAHGVGAEDRVGVLARRGSAQIEAVLGVLRAGGAWVPLDPSQPQRRLADLLRDTGTGLVLAPQELAHLVPPDLTLLTFEELPLYAGSPLPPDRVLPQHLAYVFHTSGSTGQPKGVMVSHGAAHAAVAWRRRRLGLGPHDRVMGNIPPTFDPSVWQLFGPLGAGARLVLAPAGSEGDAGRLADRVAKAGVTVLDLPPALFHELFRAVPEAGRDLPTLRAVFIGGQSLPVEALERYMERLPVEWIDVYGPTEAVIEATAWNARTGSGRRVVPIGRPTDGRVVMVLGPHGDLVPAGTPGMLAVGGPALARGYQGRPAATAEAFRPDPYARTGGARLYRTGDLARWLPTGELEFLGRADRQVKIGGLRMEPGEVEAVLGGHPDVVEAAVDAREVAPGDARLVAWVETAPGAEAEMEGFRGYLSDRLPAGMVPSLWSFLDELPRTASGKVDRHALETPRPRASAAGRVAPRTPTEKRVAEVWQQVLGVSEVGADDDFFALGGHSLAATRAAARLRRELGVELPLETVFEETVLAELAARLDAAGADAAGSSQERPAPDLPPLRPAPRDADLPLSFAEERMWFLDRFQPGVPAYNIAVGLRLRPRVDLPALAAALRELVRHHEPLRTVYPETRAGRPRRVIRSPGSVAVPGWSRVDLSALPDGPRGGAARNAAEAVARRPLNLARGPLFAPVLLDGGAQERTLLLVMHHIVTDGRSIEVTLADLEEAYDRAAGGAPAGDPGGITPPALQYADFAAWQRDWMSDEVVARRIAWWRDRLAGLAPLELPTDHPRPRVRSQRGGGVEMRLDAVATAGVRRLAKETGATPFMVLLAGFLTLLSRLTHRSDLAVGTPVANRNHPEVQDMPGLFVNTVVLRADLAGDPSFRDLVARTRRVTLDAFAHQDLPFERLVAELEPERDPSRTPLVQAILVLQSDSAEGAAPGGDLARGTFDVGTRTSKFDLSLSLGFAAGDGGEELGGFLEYDAALFDRATAEAMARRLERLLGAAVANPEGSLSRLPLLSGTEQERTARGRLGPPEEPSWEGTVPSLDGRFRQQARRDPGATAVTFGDRSLTYGQLDAAADRVAHRLAALGAGPESRVGLATERGLEMVVGILGIIRCGAAYVPLDPSLPAERLQWIRRDSGLRLVAGTAEGLAAVPGDDSDAVPLEALLTSDDDVAPFPEVPDPDLLAYVLYTSGSTGRPKGVGVTRRQVVRLLDSCGPLFDFADDEVWALFHSYGFDISVWELWGALTLGGRLVVVPHWVSRSPADFLGLLERERVTVLHQTPSAFAQLMQADVAQPEPAAHRLRWVILAGEMLDVASLEPWFRRHGDRAPRLVNMYGITETTVYSTWRPVAMEDVALAPVSPIGGPLPNLRIHLLGRHGEPVPPGVPGEIHVAGGGVARGYPTRPGLTADRFRPDPFAGTGSGAEAGDRLYASGDLARWVPYLSPLPDASKGETRYELAYLGRIDQQVQVRGFRVEPGEIAGALLLHPEVGEAVVVARGEGAGLRLVAYVVAASDGGADLPAPDELRAFLSNRIPDYMVPATFVPLDALPLTPNGKLDRRALPAPEETRPELSAAYTPPRTPEEEALASLLADVLGLDRVGVHDNFFDLGGQSLLAVEVVARVRQRFAVDLPLQTLFTTPTVGRLAYEIAQRQAAEVDEGELAELLDEMEALSVEEAERVLSEEGGE